MFRILVLSNGHGEDLSGSLLARKLVENGHKVDAIPLVGNGIYYQKEEISIIGKTKEFNTGGLGYNSLKGRISDLFNGQVFYFIRKLFLTLLISSRYDYFLVVGDVVPILFAWLARKKYFVYLVAYSSHYEGQLNLPWPCKLILCSKITQRIYSRDLLTSEDLTYQLRRNVYFFGNPFMDNLLLLETYPRNYFQVALLPGSRMPELLDNFQLIIELLEIMAKNKYFENIKFYFVLTNNFSKEKLKEILQKRNWKYLSHNLMISDQEFQYDFITIKCLWNSFDRTLINSDLVISMSGTAAEQAVGLSKPVIQIEGRGPQFTKIFADAQRRLLGKYVFCSTKYKNKREQIEFTIALILKVIYLIKLDNRFLVSCKKNAKTRLGEKGAIQKITQDIINTASR